MPVVLANMQADKYTHEHMYTQTLTPMLRACTCKNKQHRPLCCVSPYGVCALALTRYICNAYTRLMCANAHALSAKMHGNTKNILIYIYLYL